MKIAEKGNVFEEKSGWCCGLEQDNVEKNLQGWLGKAKGVNRLSHGVIGGVAKWGTYPKRESSGR